MCIYILQEQNRLKLPTAATNAPLTQREVVDHEPTDEEFRSAFNIMPRILQLLNSASHGQLHPQTVSHQNIIEQLNGLLFFSF